MMTLSTDVLATYLKPYSSVNPPRVFLAFLAQGLKDLLPEALYPILFVGLQTKHIKSIEQRQNAVR